MAAYLKEVKLQMDSCLQVPQTLQNLCKDFAKLLF